MVTIIAMWGLTIVLSYAKSYQALLTKQNRQSGISNPIRVAPADGDADEDATTVVDPAQKSAPTTIPMLAAGVYYAAHISMAIYIVVEIGK